jgi:hypothetical protein
VCSLIAIKKDNVVALSISKWVWNEPIKLKLKSNQFS